MCAPLQERPTGAIDACTRRSRRGRPRGPRPRVGKRIREHVRWHLDPSPLPSLLPARLFIGTDVCGRAPCSAHLRVKCTFIFDKQKKRVTVPGMVGWSLLATAKHHGLPLNGATKDNDWDYVTLGEGPGSVEDHIILPQADFERVGPCTWQEEALLKANEPHMQPTCALPAPRPARQRWSSASHVRTHRLARTAAHPPMPGGPVRNAPQVAPRCVRHPDQGHGWAHRIRTVHQCRPHQLCAGQGPATAPATYPFHPPPWCFYVGSPPLTLPTSPTLRPAAPVIALSAFSTPPTPPLAPVIL